MNTTQIKRAGSTVLGLIHKYSADSRKKLEMRQDPLLFGYFAARFGKMSRQWSIHIGESARPKRIDFRHGGSNPVLIEFAVRPPHGRSELYGPGNKAELNKLCRFPPAKAKLRVLLLLDLAEDPIEKANLMKSYAGIKSSRGRYKRYPVRVIYTHKNKQYDFMWSG